MSSLHQTNFVPASSSPSSTLLASSGLAQNDLTSAASLFSSLLDQMRGAIGEKASRQSFSSSLQTESLAPAQMSRGSALPELRSSWKSFLNTWSSKLRDIGQRTPINSSTAVSVPLHENSHGESRSSGASVASRQSANDRQEDNSADSCVVNGSNNTVAQYSSHANTTSISDNSVSARVANGVAVEAGMSAQDSAPAATDDTLSELFAEMQSLLAQLQQRLQTPQGGEGQLPSYETQYRRDDSSSPYAQFVPDLPEPMPDSRGFEGLSAPSIPPQDIARPAFSTVPLTKGNSGDDVADMLQDLLTLTKGLDQELGLSQNDQRQNSTTDLSPPVEELKDQLRADLKALTENLKSALSSTSPASASSFPSYGKDDTLDRLSSVLPNGLTQPSAQDSPLVSALPQGSANDLVSNAFSTAAHVAHHITILANAGGEDQAPSRVSQAPAYNFTEGLRILSGAGGKDGSATDFSGFGQHSGTSSGNLAGNTAGNAAIPLGQESVKGSSPYSFASQLASLRSANGGLTTLSSPSEQVIVHLHRALANGDERLSIQLNPAELGRIDIKLNMSGDGKVQGTVVVSNPSTLDLLQKDARGLERALQEAGLQADAGSLNFSLGGQQGGAFDQAAQDRLSKTAHDSRKESSLPQNIADLDAVAEHAHETWVISPNRVNVRV